MAANSAWPFYRHSVGGAGRGADQRRVGCGDPGHRNLAVEGGRIRRGLAVPESRPLRIARRVGGEACPVGRACPADRHGYRAVHALEMERRTARIVQEAKRDPTRQPLGFGIGRGRCLLVTGGKRVGLIGQTVLQGAARQDGALPPPELGTGAEVLRQRHQESAGILVAILLSPPAQPLVDKTWMIAKRLRHARNRPIHPAGVGA